jgi:hypothetical protein|tara:strand:+ start:13889 stop:14077 length:189 start_codon:yes stop_codon:yes gene_type:complete
MEKLIEELYHKLFLKKERDMSKITCKFTTVHPPRRISEQQWFREFNVSMLHGRTIVYIENHS